MKPISLGKFFGLQIEILPQFFTGSLILWIIFTAIAYYWIGSGLGESLLLGFLATLLHWTVDLIHSLGHALAAKWTGYPMSGITFGRMAFLAQTNYPDNEPALPPSIHIRRALGGPLIHVFASIILYLSLPLWVGNWHWLGLFALLENIALGLSVFLPLGFNDGSTILRNLSKKSS